MYPPVDVFMTPLAGTRRGERAKEARLRRPSLFGHLLLRAEAKPTSELSDIGAELDAALLRVRVRAMRDSDKQHLRRFLAVTPGTEAIPACFLLP